MHLELNIELQKRLQRCAWFLVGFVLLIAAGILAGWLLNIKFLIRPFWGFPAMSPASAVAFILSSFSLFLLSHWKKSKSKRAVGRVLLSIVLLIAFLKIIAFVIGPGYGLDRAIYSKQISLLISGNMDFSMLPISGFCFFLTSFSLLLLNYETTSKRNPAQLLALTSATIGLLILIGYLYQVKSFYGLVRFKPMSIESAICFLLISMAILYTNPRKGIMRKFSSKYTGTFTARSLIPFVVIIPVLLGLLRLWGTWSGTYRTGFGTVILVLGYFLIILVMLRHIAALLNSRDLLKEGFKSELRKTELGFRLLVDNVEDYAIFMIDEKGFIKSWNEGARRIKGYAAKEIIGEHFSTFYTKEDIAKRVPELNISRAVKNGHFRSESWRIRKDGSRFWADIVFTPIYDDQASLIGIAKVTRDMTEHKKAEDQIRYMSRLMEDTSDAVFSTDLMAKIKTWNRAAELLFGYTREEVNGSLSALVLRTQISETKKIELHENLTQNGYWKGELVYLRKDGEPLNIQISVSGTRSANGELNGYFVACRDFTERIRLEKRLRKFNEDLEAQVIIKTAELTNIFERVTDAFIAFDKEGKFTYINKKAAELNKWNALDLIGKNVWVEFPEEKKSLFYENFYKAISTQQNMHFEMYSTSLQIWIENYLYPSPDGLSHFFRDITQKKRSEEQIIREKKLSDTIINSLPGIFYLFDNNGTFLRWNMNLETVSGYSTHEISKMSPVDLFENHEKAYIIERLEEVSTKGVIDLEANFVTKKGQRIPYYFTAKAVTYEDRTCFIGTGINISVRIKAEQQLRLSVQKYKLLFENNPLPMWMLSLPDLTIIDVNESALVHYGYSKEEFLSLDPREMGLAEGMQRQINDPENHLSGIINRKARKHKKKDGSIIYVEIHSYDFIYENRKARLLLSHDITEKRIAEESLRKSFENIRELASHLQNIREDERAAIAREIHDQLGQQLTGLKMDMAWLSKMIHTTKESPIMNKIDGALELLDNTIKTVRKIATDLRPSIIDDLGAIAAIEWQSQEFEKRSGIVTRFKSEITEHDFPPTMAIGLFRICQESLTNIGRHSAAKNILITLESFNEEVILKIADDGIGFAMQQIGHKKTLGLLGMRERAQMMGGECEISSSPGNGTTLVARIPINMQN